MMESIFQSYGDKIKEYHLYASKNSSDREKIRELIVPLLVDMDEVIHYHQNYNIKSINSSISEVFGYILPLINDFEDYDQYHLQYSYFLIDYLFMTPIVLELNYAERIPKIADTCRLELKPFVILHELAVLSWYDELLEPDSIFPRLLSYDLSTKEVYHILGELSLRIPQVVIEFQYNEKLLDSYYEKRLIKKLRTSRKRDLNKDMEISLSLEEVNQLINRYFSSG